MLLNFPLELLHIILDYLSNHDLWALYNTLSIFRPLVAQRLFRTTEIYFESIFPRFLNKKSLPTNRIFDILGEWLPHIQEINLYCQECSTQPDLFNLLSYMPNLKQCRRILTSDSIYGSKMEINNSRDDLQLLFDYPSLRDIYIYGIPFSISTPGPVFTLLKRLYLGDLWTGVVLLPELQSLQDLSVCFHPSHDVYDDRGSPCVVFVNFVNLPRLESLTITRLDEGNLVLSGKPRYLERLYMYDSYMNWRIIPFLTSLGSKLKEIRVKNCGIRENVEIYRSVARNPFNLSQLKVLELEDSINFLPLFLPDDTSSLEEVIVNIGENDFEEDWEHLQKFLRLLFTDSNSINVSLHNNGYSLDHEFADLFEFERYYRNYFISE